MQAYKKLPDGSFLYSGLTCSRGETTGMSKGADADVQ